MLVRMKTHITGYRNEEPWPPVGGTIELPDHEGRDLIVAGYAEEARHADPRAQDRDADAGTNGDTKPRPEDLDRLSAGDLRARVGTLVTAGDLTLAEGTKLGKLKKHELVELLAASAHLVDADGNPVELPDGGDPATAEPGTIAPDAGTNGDGE